jgi:hypothetical protein
MESAVDFRPHGRLSDTALSYGFLQEEWMKYTCLGYIRARESRTDDRGRATRKFSALRYAARGPPPQRAKTARVGGPGLRRKEETLLDALPSAYRFSARARLGDALG